MPASGVAGRLGIRPRLGGGTRRGCRRGSTRPASWWPTISSAMRPTSISASRSTPVSMPISSQSSTSSSVQILPAAFGWPANGQPPSPPTVESNWVTPIFEPGMRVGDGEPAGVVQVQRDRHVGPAAAHLAEHALDAHRRRPAHRVGEREVFDVGAGLLGDREPVLQRRDHLRRGDVALVVAAERRHHPDPRHRRRRFRDAARSASSSPRHSRRGCGAGSSA